MNKKKTNRSNLLSFKKFRFKIIFRTFLFYSMGKTLKLKRVVVTGLGALTPIGNTIEDYWNGLRNGVSGAGHITRFDTTYFKTKFMQCLTFTILHRTQ